METLNQYGPWGAASAAILTAVGFWWRNRTLPDPKPKPSPVGIEGLLSAAGGLPGLLKLFAQLPLHVEEIRRILTAVLALIDTVSRLLPKEPPK